MYESSKTLVKQLDNIGDKLANVVEDFQKKQQTRSSRDRDRNRSNSRDRNNSGDNYRNRIGIEEITTEIGTEIEVEIGEIVETIQEIEIEVEVETGLTPEKEDQDQVKDILTEMISATTVTEQVMLHVCASDLKII